MGFLTRLQLVSRRRLLLLLTLLLLSVIRVPGDHTATQRDEATLQRRKASKVAELKAAAKHRLCGEGTGSNAELSSRRLDFDCKRALTMYEYETCQLTVNTPSVRKDKLLIFRYKRLCLCDCSATSRLSTSRVAVMPLHSFTRMWTRRHCMRASIHLPRRRWS